MRSFFDKAKTAIYVSEPDIQAALDHLRALPYSKADSTPQAWDRQGLLVELQEQANIRLFVVEAGLSVMLRILSTGKRGSFRRGPDNLRVGVQNCLYIVNIDNHLCCTPDRK